MVKIPGLDDLKKMGSDLIDSAKTVKFGNVVDKLKSGIESVGQKKDVEHTDEDLRRMFAEVQSALQEIATAQASQSAAVKKMQALVSELALMTERYQKPAATVSDAVTKEEGEKK